MIIPAIAIALLLAGPPRPGELHTAAQAFQEAQAGCTRDGGKLWGASLCAPLLLVDPVTRQVFASQADANGALTEVGGVFVGNLPLDQNVSNTSTDWSGVSWAELLWPLPPKAADRDVLLFHEMFHHAQKALGLDAPPADNPQLDTLKGRVLIRLEWAALERALVLSGPGEKRAIADALIFGAQRHKLFPGSEQSEQALERHEGLAEYTGISLAFRTQELRGRYAIKDLHRIAKAASYVRSFAYATGPAVGLLLDRHVPTWRPSMKQGIATEAILAGAIRWHPPQDLAAAALKRSRSYQGAKIRSEEQARARALSVRISKYKAVLVTGRTLRLPLHQRHLQFDPRTLVPLEGIGTVYPTLRVVDDWGVLEVKKQGLVTQGWASVVVAAPNVTTGQTLSGDGWVLTLAPGYRVVPDGRGFTVARAPAQSDPGQAH